MNGAPHWARELLPAFFGAVVAITAIILAIVRLWPALKDVTEPARRVLEQGIVGALVVIVLLACWLAWSQYSRWKGASIASTFVPGSSGPVASPTITGDPEPIPEADQRIVNIASGIDKWCGRAAATVLGSNHVLLSVADTCEWISDRMLRSLEALPMEWDMTMASHLGDRKLTDVMRSYAANCESACSVKWPNLLLKTSPYEREIEAFVDGAQRLRVDLRRDTLLILDDRTQKHSVRHASARKALPSLLHRAEDLDKKARDIAEELRNRAREAHDVIAGMRCA